MKLNVGNKNRRWHKGIPLGKVLKALQDLYNKFLIYVFRNFNL